MADIPVISGSDTGTWKSILNTIIGLINGKINSRPYIWANATARTTFLATAAGVIGEYGYQTDTQVTYRLTSTTTAVAWSSPWITYTATLTNITLGTGGTSTFTYRYEQGSIRVRGRIKLGTASIAVGSAPTFTLPVASRAVLHAYETFFGRSVAYDASGQGNYLLSCVAQNTSTTVVELQSLSSTLGGPASVSSTAPFTWAINDAFDIDCLYEIV